MKKMRTMTAAFALLMLCMLGSSCDVHEFPAEGLEHDVVLELTFDRDLPMYREVEIETKAEPKSWTKASTDPGDYDLRHVLQIYRADKKGNIGRTVYKRMVFSSDDVALGEDRIRLALPEGTYRFIVWTDHVLEGGADYFYNTTQFEEISLQGPHVGCNDLKDVFKGAADSYVRSGVETVVSIAMDRPSAKYTFISTDFEEFRTKVLTMLAVKGEDTKAINLDDFKVVFKYTGFMPSAYNLYTMKPADAKTGVLFETRMSQLDEKHAELGFDYVFVNGEEGSVGVAVETYDMDNNKMAESKPFEVPLARGKHTIVKGKFLTTMSSGAIGIDPGFDGNFNVEIP